MLRMALFVFSSSLCKQACNGRRKNKSPLAGVFVFCLFVELKGQKSNLFEQDLLNLSKLEYVLTAKKLKYYINVV
jgi:hypothetical protein